VNVDSAGAISSDPKELVEKLAATINMTIGEAMPLAHKVFRAKTRQTRQTGTLLFYVN
jgi:hypothetical protein